MRDTILALDWLEIICVSEQSTLRIQLKDMGLPVSLRVRTLSDCNISGIVCMSLWNPSKTYHKLLNQKRVYII